MTTLADYITALALLAPGEYPWSGADLTAKETLAVNMALKEHSRHRPREIVEDVSGDGGFDYALSGLVAWKDGFSVIRQVEYPVDDTDDDADILDDDDWIIYGTPDGDMLRFMDDTPDADEEFRVTYTAGHDFSGAESECTIMSFDEEAVQALAASHFLRMLSTYYAQSGDSTIAADSVDHKSRAQEYRTQAKTLAKVYYDHVGVQPDGPVSGGFAIGPAPETDRIRLTH